MASPSVEVAVLPQTSHADIGRRILAHVIDITIAFAVTMAAGFLVLRLRTLGLWTVPEGALDPLSLWRALSGTAQLAMIAAFVISKGPLYSGLLQASAWQASIGKRLLNVYVTDTSESDLVSCVHSVARLPRTCSTPFLCSESSALRRWG
jgi:hypothetical protein